MAAEFSALKLRSPGRLRPGARCAAAMALVAVALLWCLAVALGLRRLAGALVQPLEPALLVTCAAAILLTSIALQRLFDRIGASPSAIKRWQIATTMALAVIACSLSLPQSSPLGLVLLWMAVILPEVAAHVDWSAWRDRLVRLQRTARAVATDEPPSQPSASAGQFKLFDDHARPVQDDELLDEIAAAEEFDPGIVQQVTRLRHDDGQESVIGWCRVHFAAGQRQASSHLAFCPPLERVPVIELEQIDGPDARLKAGQTLAHGVRVELKLSQPTGEPSEVLYRFHAR